MNPKPNLLVISESHLQFNHLMSVPGYQSYTRNRSEKSQGGIATSVIESNTKDCLKVAEGKGSNEYLITRHSEFSTPINVINVYGEQENRTSASDIKDHWNEIVEEIVKIEAKGEAFVLLGDTNKHIGNLVEGNHEKITAGGKLIR